MTRKQSACTWHDCMTFVENHSSLPAPWWTSSLTSSMKVCIMCQCPLVFRFSQHRRAANANRFFRTCSYISCMMFVWCLYDIQSIYMVLSSIQIHLPKRVLFLPSHRDSAMLLCIAAIHLLPSWNPARFDACKITSHGCINVAIQTHHSTAMKLLDSAVFRISNFRLYTRDYKRYTCSNFGCAKSMKSYEIWNGDAGHQNKTTLRAEGCLLLSSEATCLKRNSNFRD